MRKIGMSGRVRLLLPVMVVAGIVLGLPAVAQAAPPPDNTCVRRVDGSGGVDAVGCGTATDWSNACATVQYGVDEAAAVATDLAPCDVWVTSGNYRVSGYAQSTLTLPSYVWVFGGFAGTESVRSGRALGADGRPINPSELDGRVGHSLSACFTGGYFANYDVNGCPPDRVCGDCVCHVVTVAEGSYDGRLDGVTVQYGAANNDTGAYCDLISAPFGTGGGGLYSPGKLVDQGQTYHTTDFVLANSRFQHNFALRSGGGVFAHFTDDLVIENTLFDDNTNGDLYYGDGMWDDTGGSDIAMGGAVHFAQETDRPIIRDSEFRNSKSRLGGAVYIAASSVCTAAVPAPLDENCWDDPVCAAPHLEPVFTGCPLIERSVFEDNRATERGGAISVYENSPTIRDSIFRDNNGSADRDGTAGSYPACDLQGSHNGPSGDLGGSAISFNAYNDAYCVTYASGQFTDYRVRPIVENCEFYGNETWSTGTVKTRGCVSPKIVNCTFAANRDVRACRCGIEEMYGAASWNERGVSLFMSWTLGATQSARQPTPMVINSIFWDDVCTGCWDITGVGQEAGCDPLDERDLIRDSIHGQNIPTGRDVELFSNHIRWSASADPSTELPVDPEFVDINGSDLHLMSNSPCLDAADASLDTPQDIEGNDRQNATSCALDPLAPDMGAYEFVCYQQQQGDECATDLDCANGATCDDGYCCDRPCDGPCRSCGVVGYEGTCVDHPADSDPEGCPTCQVCNGSGACTFVADGLDPMNDCNAETQASCGRDGACDGAGACRLWAAGTECVEQTCPGGFPTLYLHDTCDGNHQCVDGGSQDCTPYMCNEIGHACWDTCVNDDACVANDYFCCLPGRTCDPVDYNTCVGLKTLGESCSQDAECFSGSCVDYVCCDDPCLGACRACNLPASLGSCGYHDPATDPEDDCTLCMGCNGAGVCINIPEDGSEPQNQCVGDNPTNSCDGQGNCQKDLGAACASAAECSSGNCVDDVCCDTGCAGGCLACDLAGSVGTCSGHPSGSDPEDDCSLCQACSGSGSCVLVAEDGSEPNSACASENPENSCDGTGSCQLDLGAVCAGQAQCASDLCVDGVCCNTDCSGDCRACDLAGSLGTCTNHATGSDPENDCGTCLMCDTGACINVPEDGDEPNDACVTVNPNDACDGLGSCQLDVGGACAGDHQCASGHCTDDVCCDVACDGDCQACNLAGSVGTCSNHPSGSDPENDCAVCLACGVTGICELVAEDGSEPNDACLAQNPENGCDGAGSCQQDLGATCIGQAQCASDFCIDGVCCADDCSGVCRACDLAGSEGTCTNHGIGGDPENDCGTCLMCDTGACVNVPEYGDEPNDACIGVNPNDSCDGLGNCQLDTGETCVGDHECASGYCVDGVCCDVACDGDCVACNLMGSVGTCSGHALGSDPDDDCALCQRCDGLGSCELVPEDGSEPNNACALENPDNGCDGLGYCQKDMGVSCVGDHQCASDYCTDAVCCDVVCDGDCQACNLAGNVGTCSNHPTGGDPEADCATCLMCDAGACVSVPEDGYEPNGACWPHNAQNTCDGANACQKTQGESCGSHAECESGFCIDGLCCENDCSGDCRACNLAGQEGTCASHPGWTDPDYDCDVCQMCNGSGGCIAVPLGGAEPNDACLPENTSNTCDGAGQCQHDNGGACGLPAHCTSGFCSEGTCCNESCVGLCRACDVAGSEGTCVFHALNTDPEDNCSTCEVCDGAGGCTDVPDGQDPLDECTPTPESTCGHDGVCSGFGSCRNWASGTVCEAQTCVGETLYPADTCNGFGGCAESGSQSCAPYACAGDSCGTSCVTSAECANDYYCSAGACLPKKDDGAACTLADECLSDICNDEGICCGTACDGPCVTCNAYRFWGICLNQKDGTDPELGCDFCEACNAGVCAPATSGSDPKNECAIEAVCGQDGTCDGAGGCRLYLPGVQCLTQACSWNAGLGEYVENNDHTCDGAGTCAEGGVGDSCGAYTCDYNVCRTSCSDDTHCVPDHYCDAGVCLPDKANGESCQTAAECLSGHCVDDLGDTSGVCCNNGCVGGCIVCEGDVDGSGTVEDDELAKVGTCNYLESGADPKEYYYGGACNGVGGKLEVRYVKSGGSDNNDCKSWETACAKIQAGVDKAPANSDVWVAAAGSDPVSNVWHRYRAASGATAAVHFTSTDVNTRLRGGFRNDATSAVDHSLVKAQPRVNQTWISAIYSPIFPATRANHVIYVQQSNYTTIDGFVLYKGNAVSPNRGGGVYVYLSTDVTIEDCELRDNQATYGGGLYVYFSRDFRMTNSLFHDNSANYGGAIYTWASGSYLPAPLFTHVTLADNTSSNGAAGIQNYINTSRPTFRNSILWNSGSEYSGYIYAYNSDLEGGCVFSCSGTGNINADPDLTAGYGLACASSSNCSPAVDAASDTYATDLDMAGNPRFVDLAGVGTSTSDMGCFEVQAFAP